MGTIANTFKLDNTNDQVIIILDSALFFCNHGKPHRNHQLDYHFLFVSIIITSTAKPEHYATHTLLVEKHASHFPNNYTWDEVNYI